MINVIKTEIVACDHSSKYFMALNDAKILLILLFEMISMYGYSRSYDNKNHIVLHELHDDPIDKDSSIQNEK